MAETRFNKNEQDDHSHSLLAPIKHNIEHGLGEHSAIVEEYFAKELYVQSQYLPYIKPPQAGERFVMSARQGPLLAAAEKWDEHLLGDFRVHVENPQTRGVIDDVLRRVDRNPSPTVQAILGMAKKHAHQDKLRLYGLDASAVANDAAGQIYYFPDGSRKVFLQTKNVMGTYWELMHELTHDTLPLATPFALADPLYLEYAPRIRAALCRDFWRYKKMSTPVVLQRRVADWIFHKPYSLGYSKVESAYERLPFFIQSLAESEMAVRTVAPETYSIVAEYVKAQVTASTKQSQFLPLQSIKTWDVNFSKNLLNKTWGVVKNTFATHSEVIGKSGMKMFVSYLTALDASHRLDSDRVKFPNLDEAAYYGGVITDMAVDFALFGRVAHLLSFSRALPIMLVADMGGEMANAIRHVKPKDMRNNPDFFAMNLAICEFSDELKQLFWDDFNRGGKISRDLNEAFAREVKTSYKFFEWYHDIKKSSGNLVRTMVDGASHHVRRLVHAAPLPAKKYVKKENPQVINPADAINIGIYSAPPSKESEKKDESEIINLVEAIDREISPTPKGADALTPQATYHGSVETLEKSDKHLLLNVGVGSTLLTTDIHYSLNHLDALSGTQIDSAMQVTSEAVPAIPKVTLSADTGLSSTGSSYKRKREEAQDVPFISNVGIGKVGDKLGVVATVAGLATVGVTAGEEGFMVAVTAEFGSEFWASMGAGLTVGAVVAGAILAVRFFIHKNEEHIRHKINAGIKRTNKESERINAERQNLFQRAQQAGDEAFLQSLLNESESLIQRIQKGIRNEDKRADYAKDHDSSEAKKAHKGVIKFYKDLLSNLKDFNHSLRLEQAELNFIKNHAGASHGELITLAKKLIVKFDTQKAAQDAVARENKQAATIDAIKQYYDQGYELFEHKNGDTKGKRLSLEAAIQALKDGKIIEAKKLLNPKDSHPNKDWKSLPEFAYYEIYNDVELAEISGVRALIIKELINLVENGLVNEAKELLNETRSLHEFGSQAADLKLQGLYSFVDQLANNLQQPPSYWVNGLQDVKVGKKVLTAEELVVFKSFVSNQLLNIAINQALQGKYETAKTIFNAIQTELPEYRGVSSQLLEKIKQLQPHIDNADYCMQLLIKNNQDKSRGTQVENLLEDAILHSVVKRDIFSQVAQGESDKAEARCVEYINGITAENDAKINDYRREINDYRRDIKTLDLLKGKTNDDLFTAWDVNKSGSEIIGVTLHRWILNNVFNLVLNNNKSDAIKDLQRVKDRVKDKDPLQVSLCDRLITTIEDSSLYSDKNEDFWVSEYKRLQAEQNTLPKIDDGSLDGVVTDPHADSVIRMGKTLATRGLLDFAFEKAGRGFNREAADTIAKLGDQSLTPIEENFRFSHQGQVIGIFAKPIQSIAVKFVRGFKPSPGKSAVLGAFEGINIAQIVVPSAVPLFLQATHAKFVTKNTGPAQRNWEVLKQQIWHDMKHPLGNYGNGALIISQLFLKGIEYFPLKWVCSNKKLYQAEEMRLSFVSYGNLGVRATFTGTSVLQAIALRKQFLLQASSPHLIANFASTLSDMVFWGYKTYKSKRGEDPEYPEYYYWQDNTSSVLTSLGVIAFAGAITGGVSWVASAAFAVFGGKHFYDFYNQTDRKDNAAKALKASCNNISFYSDIASASRSVMEDYTDRVSYRLVKGELPVQELDSVKNEKSIIFVQGKKSYYIFIKNKSGNLQIEIERQGFFDLLMCRHPDGYFSEGCYFDVRLSEDEYDEMVAFATACVINKHIEFNMQNIESLLKAEFGGLAYVSNNPEQEIANFARLTHFYQTVKNLYAERNYKKVIEITEKYNHNNKIVINADYQIPPYLAWQIILYFRLLAFIESESLLLDFSVQYEEYVNYIYTSADECQPWYECHWAAVNKSLAQILACALTRFVVAANDASKVDDKIKFLELVTKKYDKCQANWYDLLEDKYKLYAAYFWRKLNRLQEKKLFMDHIDWEKLVDKKEDIEITTTVLTMLDDKNTQECNLEDFLASLKILSKEKNKNLQYWMTLDALIVRCLESANYAANPKVRNQVIAKLYAWRKICLDYIQTFDLAFEHKKRTGVQVGIVMQFLDKQMKLLGVKKEDIEKTIKTNIDRLHKGINNKDSGINIFIDLEAILNDIAYEYVDHSEKHKYLPLTIPDDADWLFHIFNISSEKGCELLKNIGKLDDEIELINALAAALNKNLRMFKVNASGKLERDNRHIGMRDDKFETIDILLTSTSGFCSDTSKFNHYILLRKLNSAIIELTADQGSAEFQSGLSSSGLPTFGMFPAPQVRNPSLPVTDSQGKVLEEDFFDKSRTETTSVPTLAPTGTGK